MKEYAIYPFKFMNITQRHDQGNHLPHWKNSTNYSDKPWDEACEDSGRSYFEPQNDFIVEDVLGINSNVTNSVRLKSINKLYIPYKKDPDYLYLTLTHMNEDNLKQVKKGQILKKGTKILIEGTDGVATGNHFHITANLGKYYGLLQNSNNAWCFTYDKSLLPEEAFYLNSEFTTIKNLNGYKFINVPLEYYGNPVERNESVDQIEILVDDLRARSMPSIVSGEILGYMYSGIYNVTEIEVGNGYTWYKTDNVWFASGEWTKLYSKKEEDSITDSNNEKQNVDNIYDATGKKKDSILTIIIELIKKIFKIKN